MTTPRDEATALLAEALEAEVRRVARDLSETWPPKYQTFEMEAEHILAASPTLAADLAFAAAWRRVERALPSGWLLHGVAWDTFNEKWRGFAASADPGGGRKYAYGPTPTAALLALAETLEAMR